MNTLKLNLKQKIEYELYGPVYVAIKYGEGKAGIKFIGEFKK